MEGSHALSLKVMRLSRPTLATAPQPYFGERPELSEHAAASVLSLQETASLSSSLPSTMRDFALSEVLTLSATFGSIQLGETFASIITVNNDSYHPGIDISSVQLKVEMQTSTAKVAIGGTGGDATALRPATFVETIVHHEIKELGQHVLACTLSYRIPAALVNSYPTPPDDPADPTLRLLRKYYKFMVTNPLSVKTKVQAAKSANAQLSAREREKVFLEVHIQNLTQKPMTFQRIRFECVDGWTVDDVNDGVYAGAAAIMPAQEVRQYLYVLTPHMSKNQKIVTPPTPGSIIPLGRLDISWTTSFGEPGRLLTSLLSRRVPLEGPPPTALPPHIQPQNRPTPRPQSPPISSSRPSSPAPFKVRGELPRPQSPLRAASMPVLPAVARSPDVTASLLIRSTPPRDAIRVREPFRVAYTLTLATPVKAAALDALGIAIQFLESKKRDATREEAMQIGEAGTTVGSAIGTPVRGSFNLGDLVNSPVEAAIDGLPDQGALAYPEPFRNSDEASSGVRADDGEAVHIGSSILRLPSPWTTAEADEQSFDFEAEFVAVSRGLLRLGSGLRVVDSGHRVLAEWRLIGQVVVN